MFIPLYVPLVFVSGYIGYYYGLITNNKKYNNTLSFVQFNGKYIYKNLSVNNNVIMMLVKEVKEVKEDNEIHKYECTKIIDGVSCDNVYNKEELINELVNYISIELTNSEIISMMDFSNSFIKSDDIIFIEKQIENLRSI